MDFAINTFIFRGFSHGFCLAENVAAAQSLGFQGLLYDARKANQGDLAKAGHVETSWDIMEYIYIILVTPPMIYDIYRIFIYTVYILYIYIEYTVYIYIMLHIYILLAIKMRISWDI